MNGYFNHLFLRVLTLACIFSFTILFEGCQDSGDNNNNTDFTTPGNRGTINANDRHAKIVEAIGTLIPNPLPCNNTVVVVGIAEERLDEPETCDGYDFTFLYKEAFHQADSRVKELQCPTNEDSACPENNAFIIKQSANCQNNLAQAEVHLAFKCRGVQVAQINGLPIRTDAQLDSLPFNDVFAGGYPAPSETITSEVFPDLTTAERCPATWRFLATIEEVIPNCAAINNFEPYVQKVRKLADRTWQRTRCMPNCQKSPSWTEQGLDWRCVAQGGVSKVIVRLAFTVTCQ